MPKFFNKLILLKDIQCSVRIANIILLSILSLNKVSIVEIVNILYYLIGRLRLSGIVKDTVILIKDNYLTIWNIIYIIYWK